MAGKREAKRADLTARLIAAARGRIEQAGLASLRARDITADAGCALGGLYTVFDDLDHLILTVNFETLSMLERALSDAAGPGGDPRAALKGLARAYAGFAEAHRPLWDALFDHRMSDGRPVPDWMRAKNAELLEHIVAPLARLGHSAPQEVLALRARTYFAAIHGIVSISLQQRFIGVPKDALHSELDRIVDALADAAEAGGR